MKKNINFIFILILLLTCCKINKDNNIIEKQENLINFQYKNINERLNYLLKLDTSLFIKRIKNLEEIQKEFSVLRNNINSDISNNEIEKINLKLISLGVKEENITNYISILKNKRVNVNERLLNLNFLELLLINYFSDFQNRLYFNAFRIQPIVVSQKNSIKIGEEYKGEIYLAATNGFNFVGKVNNIVLENEEETPVFKMKAIKKGKNSVKGELGIKWNIMDNDTIYLPFSINFNVE